MKSALQHSELHLKSLCDYNISVATGCLHGCSFCYVPSTAAIRFKSTMLRDRGVENPKLDWGKYLLIRDNLPELLEKELKSKRTWRETPGGRGVVLFSSGTDPYQNQATAAITRRCVELLLNHGKRVRILTRSPLWVKDLDILVHPNVIVGASVPYLSGELSRKIEPGAPVPVERLKALAKGQAAGCRVFVAMAPTIPTHGIKELKETLTAIASVCPEVIFWEPINPRGSNTTQMKKVGCDWVDEISKQDKWSRNFVRQYEQIIRACGDIGILHLIHPWFDKQLLQYNLLDRSTIEHWRGRPTVEKWNNEGL